MDPRTQHCGRYEPVSNRREFLSKAGTGLGMLALADLMGSHGLLATEAPSGAANPLAPRSPHFPAKAKSVIWLFMEGAPSSVDMFDPKPELTKRDGQRMKIDVFNGNPGPLMKSPFSFKQYGKSGAWFCEHYPNVARHVDDFAFVKSFYSESNDHVPALYQINTGIPRPGFPSAGSWVTYGLGSENKNLPGYVVLGNNQGVKGGNLNWSSGFLPSTYQGTLFRPEGAPSHQPQPPRRRHAGRPAPAARSPGGSQRRHLQAASGRGGTARPHRELRARLSHADGSHRSRGLRARIGQDPRDCTDSIGRRRGPTARNAFWPAGSSNAESGSSRSTAMASGTPTAT